MCPIVISLVSIDWNSEGLHEKNSCHWFQLQCISTVNVLSLFKAGRVLESWTHAQWQFSIFLHSYLSISSIWGQYYITTHLRKKKKILYYTLFQLNTTDAQKDSSVIKRYQILKHDSWVCSSFNPEKLTRLLRIFVICRTFQILQCAPYTTTKRL